MLVVSNWPEIGQYCSFFASNCEPSLSVVRFRRVFSFLQALLYVSSQDRPPFFFHPTPWRGRDLARGLALAELHVLLEELLAEVEADTSRVLSRSEASPAVVAAVVRAS
mgnify:CR=1 FL=1